MDLISIYVYQINLNNDGKFKCEILESLNGSFFANDEKIQWAFKTFTTYFDFNLNKFGANLPTFKK